MIALKPISQKDAKRWVNRVHRHLDYPAGDRLRVSLVDGDRLLAVGVAGTPSARNLDDGHTLEITRIASEAAVEENACSRLYAALRRAGRALGYLRFVTYTRLDEPGTSLRAAGFVDAGTTDGGEWSRPSRVRAKAKQPEPKRRWLWQTTNYDTPMAATPAHRT